MGLGKRMQSHSTPRRLILPFQIIRNDITKVKADAIVNTVNPKVAIGGGVDSAIYKTAGREKLLEARRKIGTLMPGEVATTKAFGLNAKYIIHVSSPCWIDGTKNEIECLHLCYQRALQLAKKRRCKSIAFPLLATGTYGFPKELAIQIAVDTFTEFLEHNNMEITLVVFGSEDVSVSGKWVDDVASFIDDAYVDVTLEKEYQNDTYPGKKEYQNATYSGKNEYPNAIYPGEKEYQNVRYLGTSNPIPRERKDFIPQKTAVKSHISPRKQENVKDNSNVFDRNLTDELLKETQSPESLEDALKQIYTDSFEKHLQQLINKKGLKNSQVYAAANISKQYFSKLLKGKVKPSKEKMLALAIGLHLNLDETIDFLGIAGYALSPISQRDKIVEYFILHEDYNVLKIDIVLFDYGLDPLSNQ